MDGNCGWVTGRVDGNWGSVTGRVDGNCGCVLRRVESEKPKAGEKKIKKEDPYGGSTDENTDAEEEQDQPIPELPGNSPSSSQSLTSARTFQPPLIITKLLVSLSLSSSLLSGFPQIT